MHPSIVSDKPGHCPICGMNLDQMDDDSRSSQGNDKNKERKILFYRDPMGKSRTSPVPTKDEMGMDFIPVYEDETGEESKAQPVEGRVAFSIPKDTQQMIGVTKSPVRREDLSYDIRASGKVAYEPELYQAIEEYRIALKTASISKENSLLSAAKTKLRLLGLSDDQVERVTKGGIDPKSFLLPQGTAWVYAEIFEYELALIKTDQNVDASVSALPNEKFHGKVSSISPIVDPASRTIKIRAEVDDPKRLLKPDMFVNVFIRVSLGPQLIVPESSVIYTGSRSLVFVVNDQGRFEPREVSLGEGTNDKHVVNSGLKEGEVIVTSANFLIDSESRIRGVVQQGAEASEGAHALH